VKKITISLVVTIFCIQGTFAKDIHFAQYSEAPLVLNPGLTGLFTGEYRVATSYRNQWSNLDVPFETYSLSFDTRLAVKSSSSLGLGIMAFKDIAGANQFSNTELNLYLSGVISINSKQSFSVGLSGGMLQKGLDNSNLQWESQYVNGTFDPTNPSSEVLDLSPTTAGNFSMGVAWWYFSKETHMMGNDQIKAIAGIGYHHVNQPQMKFYGGEPDRLHSKLVAHGTAQIGIKGTKLALVPGGFFAMQGASTEMLAGTMLRISLQKESKYTGLVQGMALSTGCHVRVGDAVIPSFLFEFSNFRLGFSYDVTTSKLGEINSGKGGPEFSISYTTPNPFTYKSKSGKRSYL
jgi:type IX secretion system PorP/SprF family membrane protein